MLRPLDSVLFEAFMTVSDSRTYDDITILTVMAWLAQFVDRLYGTVQDMDNALREVKGTTEQMVSTKEMVERHGQLIAELEKIIEQATSTRTR